MKYLQKFLYWLSDALYELSRTADRLAYKALPMPTVSPEQRAKMVQSLVDHMDEHLALAAELEDTTIHTQAHLDALRSQSK